MISSSVHHIRDISFCLQPSPKEMMKIDSLCFSAAWSEQDYREMQEQPTFSNWLLQVPTATQVGMLSFQSVPPELQILRLAVLPDWRKQGLAQFMLEQLEIVAKSANLESLCLEVNSANKSAIALYYKQGYQDKGIRKNYFINPLGDALLLKKILKYDVKQAAQ
jgi:ribosomal-protein-alanine N-acetyltransferase